MKKRIIFSLACCLLFFAGTLLTQEPPAMPKPAAEHAWLDQFVGEWITKTEAKMGPDQPPMHCNGTLSSRKLGGFWVLNELKGDIAGETMTGVQTIGYDVEAKKYVGTWVDSMTANMWHYQGTVDASGKVLTLEADGPNFLSAGKLTKFQDIYEFKSPDEVVMTSRMQSDDGQWITFMSGTALRGK